MQQSSQSRKWYKSISWASISVGIIFIIDELAGVLLVDEKPSWILIGVGIAFVIWPFITRRRRSYGT
ncbi:MAG: hypothetical protein Q8R37_01275 [Nanoarchaeota archaeon]|nr:hypothetical protein [Nanoarchaeota archaeon]